MLLAFAAAAAFQFPQGFLWGAATAAHQVEGHMSNDWVPWEKVAGHVHANDTSAVGVGHYERFDQDFALAEAMGHNAHRLSVEWARIEPQPGKIDWAAVDHYHAVFASLRKHHLKPMVTLFHFTNPPWVAAQGGWLAPKTADDFARFAAFMGREYGKQVDTWITLNEPNVYAFNAYDAGTWPPAHQSREEALQVMANELRGHARAYHALHEADHEDADGDGTAVQVGIANHVAVFDPMSPFNAIEAATAYFNDTVFNRAPMRAASTGLLQFEIPGARGVKQFDPLAASSVDFIGVNYYTRWVCVSGGAKERIPMPGAPTTAMGWEDYPYGLYRALQLANGYSRLPDGRHVPILITENGVDDPDGSARASYLVRHLQEVAHAIRDGVDVRGYIHWTLMDNFEWADGYRPRFGLYHVDREHGLARVPTPAVGVFERIARANALSPEIVAAYDR
jgi:beta-glucosidase